MAGRASALGVAPSEGALDARLSLLMSSGGDERIWPDAITGRTRYGTIFRPAPAEISFASSTANTISEAGYAEALRTLEALLDRGAKSRLQLQDWLCRLRTEIATLCGRSDSEVVLAASGTDAELIALAIAQRLAAGPITNIVVAPGETGSGVPRAAAGLHFQSTSCFGGPVSPGERLGGWSDADIEVRSVDIRTADGEPRDPAAVDLDVATHAERALAQGRGVLVHVLDTSKTGLGGLSRDMAARILALAPERVHVLVDACQLRCPADRLGVDLDRGFMVLVTGSKFAGGPPLSGALFLPRSTAARLGDVRPLPEGLAGYSARLDWPETLQGTYASGLTTTANLGAALRWTAALAELRRFATLDRGLTDQFFEAFAGEASRLAQAASCCRPLHDAVHGVPTSRSIIPLVIGDRSGRLASSAEAARLQAELRKPAPVHPRSFHVGQPVQIGQRTVLRVCASAPQVNALAARMGDGASFDEAFAPISRDLQSLFAKMDHCWAGMTGD